MSSTRDDPLGILQLSLFKPDDLKSTTLFNNAVMLFEHSKGGDIANFHHVLSALLSRPHALEIVLSFISEELFEEYRECILDDFPIVPAAFQSSTASVLLERLSEYLFSHEGTTSADNLWQCKNSVKLAGPVLHSLATHTFDPEEPPPFPIKQKKRKNKSQSDISVIDSVPYANLGVPVPRYAQEATALADDVLNDQRGVLEHLLDIIRRPMVRASIRRQYVQVEAKTDPPTRTLRLPSMAQSQASATPAAKAASLPVPAPGNDAPTSKRAPAAPGRRARRRLNTTASEGHAELAAVDPEEHSDRRARPLRALLDLGSADGLGEWRILVSGNAARDLRTTYRREPRTFNIIVKKITELSNGHFSPDNQKTLTGPGTEIPIYEAKMTGDLRLLYQVDCIQDFDSDIERQVLRLFGVYTHAQIDGRFWDSMSSQLSRKGHEYRRRCNFRNRPSVKGDYVVSPAVFPEIIDTPEEETSLATSIIRNEDLDGLHELLVLEKFVTFSQAFLNSILADQDIAHIFNVSPNEKAIIDHPASCYVIGRSGTGKTTTMLFKILGIERSWIIESQSGIIGGTLSNKPRQLFVTQSRVLAGKVEEYFAKLMQSLATAAYTPSELAKMKEGVSHAQERLVDEDDEDNWRSDLPTCFSELNDSHFPLFITFERLCKLLDGDINGETSVKSPVHDENAPPPSPTTARRQQASSLLSYYTFLGSYWTHFPQSLTKSLDPALVYSEFLGTIKGSEQALKTENGYLDRKTYLALSHRANSTFSTQREAVYELFLRYQKRKRELRQHDTADRTRRILKHLEETQFHGQKIDYIYVDEVQDNLLIDSLLLRLICRNPDGLFWAGDTAQTISVGSSFRFEDLTAYLFRVEEELKKVVNYPINASRPKNFQLTVNYRSHGGIVNCAHSLIRIITEFWPYSIDALGQEKGIIDGLKPTMFTGWDEDSIRYEQFLFGAAGEHMEFGAQQCILVRDEHARERLRSEVGDIGLIMTTYEAKGLEFNDVLLYNFFQDSTVDLAQWRVVLNMLSKEQRNGVAVPRFEESRHAGICSELKHLYVAVTRARKNLWIIDCSERSEPLRSFWTAHNLVEVCRPGMNVPRLAVQSTPEEWAESGRSLFKAKRYLQAMHCFERALRPLEAEIAHAYLLREKARTTTAGNERKRALRAAADAFIKCAKDNPKERRVYSRIAGECYAQAEMDREAGRAYVGAEEYTLSARHYRKGECFDEAIDVVQKYAAEVDTDFKVQFMDVARLYYFQAGSLGKAAKLFETVDEQLEFLEDFGLDIARASVLEATGQFLDAAKVHFDEDRPIMALKLLLKTPNDQNHICLAAERILNLLWRHLSFGVIAASSPEISLINDLLKMAVKFDFQNHREEKDVDQLSMFQAIVAEDRSKLLQLGRKFAESGRDKAAAMLSLDHVFRLSHRLDIKTDDNLSTALWVFYGFAQNLRGISGDQNAYNKQGIRRLFAIDLREQLYSVPKGTYLHKWATDNRSICLRSDDSGIFMSPLQISQLLSNATADRLKIRVQHHELASKILKNFAHYCMHHCIFGKCNTLGCEHQHIDMGSLTRDWFNVRLRVYLQQILVLQTAQNQLKSKARMLQQQYWLAELYHLCFPPHSSFGSPVQIDFSRIPEAPRAVPIIKEWLQELVLSLDPNVVKKQFLTTFLQSIALVRLLDSTATLDYYYRARSMTVVSLPALWAGDTYYLPHSVRSSVVREQYSVEMAMTFLGLSMENGVELDASVLCDFTDNIVMSLCVENTIRKNGVIHNVTLPRSWLWRLMRHPGATIPTRTNDDITREFIGLLARTLESIYSIDNMKKSRLLFFGAWLSQVGSNIPHILIARLCLSLCLIAYNRRIFEDDVYQVLRSLRKAERQPHPLWARFVNVSNLEQVRQALQQAFSLSSFEEMIHLMQRARTSHPPRDTPGIRVIIYKTQDDALSLLSSGVRSNLNPEATAFVPRQLPVPEVETEKEVEEENATGATEQPEVPVHEPTPEEHNAANIIRSVYIRYHRRVQQLRDTASSQQAARDAIFNQCLQVSAKRNWGSTFYRKLYLGPVVHVLLVVDKAKQWAQREKQKARKKMMVAKHLQLEDAVERQNQTKSIMTRAIDLYKKLEPGASVHEVQNSAELKNLVGDLEAFVRELPHGSIQGTEVDMALAIKGIVAEWRANDANQKEPKPDVVLDEYDMMM